MTSSRCLNVFDENKQYTFIKVATVTNNCEMCYTCIKILAKRSDRVVIQNNRDYIFVVTNLYRCPVFPVSNDYSYSVN